MNHQNAHNAHRTTNNYKGWFY